MVVKLTDDMRLALRDRAGAPVEVQDDQTKKIYLLIDPDDAPRLAEEWLRRAIQVGLDDEAAGRISPWNADEVRELCRQPRATSQSDKS